MPVFDDLPQTTRGRSSYHMLLTIHTLIRRDLLAVERLAAEVRDGMPADTLHQQLDALQGAGVLWQLQVSCMRHCSFVHLHHQLEDVHFFEELESANPAIRPVVERLRQEHRAVSEHLEAVESAATALADGDSPEARRVVVAALEVLRTHLFAHLEYEEANVAATAQRLPDVVR